MNPKFIPIFVAALLLASLPGQSFAKKRGGGRQNRDSGAASRNNDASSAGADESASDGAQVTEISALGEDTSTYGEAGRDDSSGTRSADESAHAENGALGRSPIDGVAGHAGFGYFTALAPMGIRYWMDRDSAFDIGIGGAFSTGDLESTSFAIESGYVIGLAHYHYSVVFARLGLGYRISDTSGAHSGSARQEALLNGFLGAELFLGAFGFPNISLQGGYGIQSSWIIEGGTKFLVGGASAGLNVVGSSLLGFHIYL